MMMNVRALRVGLKIAEVASFEAPRVYGEGRLRTIPDGWRVLKTIYRERRNPLPLPIGALPALAHAAGGQRDTLITPQVAHPAPRPFVMPTAHAATHRPLAEHTAPLLTIEGD